MERRSFLKSAVVLAAQPAMLSGAQAQTPEDGEAVASHPRSFPRGFLWGTATAAYQVEGAVQQDGRKPSIWDTFSHTPGKTFQGQTGDVADDHFHRYKQDVALMKQLGVKTYRFSIAWPRVFPDGTGTPNPRGIDFYKRLLDELDAAGIEPFCTLFHWDLPQALEDRGGWTTRDTSQAFAEYARYTAGQLSDRINHWMTINEFGSFIDAGYGSGDFAPGRRLSRGELAQTRHNAVLAHGLGVQAIRSAARRPVLVGLAEDVTGVMPAIDDAEHLRATQVAMREENAAYTTVILDGKYTDRYLRVLGADAPKFTAEDLRIISSPIDFLGINIYTTREVIPADSEPGYLVVPRQNSYPHMASDWLFLNPQATYWTPRLISGIWGVKSLYITENGCSADDVFRPDGHVLDTDRMMYVRNYLSQLQRAVAEGVPIKGYFLWSLLDNYEWSSGYSKRFGITYVDFTTQTRTPKLSFDFYRQVIRANAVV